MLNETVTLSVTELNEYARKLLAGDPLLRSVEVTGEISGYKHHYSGHRYFSLKDENARVQCVMFRQDALSLDFEPSDGQRVTVRGSASVFVRDGSYQLYVSRMRKAGQGDLYARFEALKKKLMQEGLFDPARKREIPTVPRVIGVATSITGAAIRDIVQVARRRNPDIGIVIAPCAVQGEAAVGEIVRSIELLNRQGECDVLLVGRGGGSIEDLWAFNEERVARAIAASQIPVISCVGHEIDFTIADFVADMRAPTPSAAAELAVPVVSELRGAVDALGSRLIGAINHGQQLRRLNLEKLIAPFGPEAFERALIQPRRFAITSIQERMNRALRDNLERQRKRLTHAEIGLNALNPASVLERGYAIVTGPRGIVSRADQAAPGEAIAVRLSGGTLRASVTEIEPEEAK